MPSWERHGGGLAQIVFRNTWEIILNGLDCPQLHKIAGVCREWRAIAFDRLPERLREGRSPFVDVKQFRAIHLELLTHFEAGSPVTSFAQAVRQEQRIRKRERCNSKVRDAIFQALKKVPQEWLAARSKPVPRQIKVPTSFYQIPKWASELQQVPHFFAICARTTLEPSFSTDEDRALQMIRLGACNWIEPALRVFDTIENQGCRLAGLIEYYRAIARMGFVGGTFEALSRFPAPLNEEVQVQILLELCFSYQFNALHYSLKQATISQDWRRAMVHFQLSAALEVGNTPVAVRKIQEILNFDNRLDDFLLLHELYCFAYLTGEYRQGINLLRVIPVSTLYTENRVRQLIAHLEERETIPYSAYAESGRLGKERYCEYVIKRTRFLFSQFYPRGEGVYSRFNPRGMDPLSTLFGPSVYEGFALPR